MKLDERETCSDFATSCELTRMPHVDQSIPFSRPSGTSARLSGLNARGVRRFAALAVTLAAGLTGLCLSGCTMYTPASRDEAFGPDEPAGIIAPSDWPARKTADLASIVASTPRVVTRWALDGTRPESELDPRTRSALRQPVGIIRYSGVHGVGIVRVVDNPPRGRETVPADPAQSDASSNGSPAPTLDEFDPGAPLLLRFVSYSELRDRPMDRRTRWFMRSLDRGPRGAPPGLRMTDPTILRALWEGTSVRLIPPSAGADTSGGGVVLHMPGLGSLEYEQPVLDELSNRGWTIVRITTPRLWWFEDSTFDISSEADIEPTAAKIARVVDDLLAEPAYAAEGVLEYLRQARPDLADRPLVLLGMSAGALMIPTVAARLGDRVDGVVVVGGGANLLRISQRSELTDAGFKLKIAPTLDRRATLERLSEEYLHASRLDPYHTAAAIRGVPALVVLAGMDTIVPAESGKLLWERLGKPERYTYSLGHALMFWSMSSQAERIANWIDRASAGAHGDGRAGPGGRAHARARASARHPVTDRR